MISFHLAPRFGGILREIALRRELPAAIGVMRSEMTGAETIDLTRSDGELLRRSRGRDDRAFAQLVERHKGLVVHYLLRLTGCRARAEDLAQETFVRFYLQLARYQDQGTLVAYLLRIATNLVRSEERRAKRWRLLEPILRTTIRRSGDPTPQAEAMADEARQMVTRAIADLDLHYRAPLVLREIEGRSYQEIAETLGCSEGTVKSRLHRAREQLRRRLAPYWNGETGHDAST